VSAANDGWNSAYMEIDNRPIISNLCWVAPIVDIGGIRMLTCLPAIFTVFDKEVVDMLCY
jgi:hypothetical protein